jgi:serine/threonine-protein phosphatase 2A activator
MMDCSESDWPNHAPNLNSSTSLSLLGLLPQSDTPNTVTPKYQESARLSTEYTNMANPAVTSQLQRLAIINPARPPTFKEPVKEINDGDTLKFFLESQACSDLVCFLMQLNYAMFPQPSSTSSTTLDPLDMPPPTRESPVIKGLTDMVASLQSLMSEAPPDPGPRRFGNVAFRTWFDLAEQQAGELLKTAIPTHVWNFGIPSKSDSSTLPLHIVELKSYLLGSFGSSQRLDYGTGHELAFIAFLGGLWKLGAFLPGDEKNIVLGIVQPYLDLVRKLILTYSLEPAGSHGVWGLDDHSFVSYIFGSAQLSPPISPNGSVPLEGSGKDAPKTASVMDNKIVEEWRQKNMYFAAIGFIYDVKTGNFWEHSPTLYDISGVATWGKINKGMLKMYQVEVLSKFPVVQHFYFGGLYEWKPDPSAATATATVHIAAKGKASGAPSKPVTDMSDGITRAPWAAKTGSSTLPRAVGGKAVNDEVKMVEQTNIGMGKGIGVRGVEGTKAPWANGSTGLISARMPVRTPAKKETRTPEPDLEDIGVGKRS